MKRKHIILGFVFLLGSAGIYTSISTAHAGIVPTSPERTGVDEEDMIFYPDITKDSLKKIYPDMDTEKSIVVDLMPRFQGGGSERFSEWVTAMLSYPADAVKDGIQGTVLASFIVDRDGRVCDMEIISSPGKPLSDEVKRVLNLSPKWQPGTQRLKPVKVMMHLPVTFEIKGQ